MDLIMQLPVHPLINHAVAVLVPVSALGAILLVVFAKLRSNYSLLLLITVISASISAFIAENSGQALANRVGSPGEHAIQGERLFKIVLVFTLIYVLWFAIHKKYIVIKGAQRVINTGLSASLVATAVASAALTFIVGHSGAAATWEDRIAASVTQPLAPDSAPADSSGKTPNTGNSPSTGKVNLVASLLAKTEYGVPRVVARINHPKNEWLFDSSWGVDVAVSTPRIISALVEEAVSVGDVVRLFSFRKGQANLVELTLPDGSACIGKTVEEIELPENAAIAAIVRDGRVITAKAHDVFAAGDELLFVASADAEAQIKACFIS